MRPGPAFFKTMLVFFLLIFFLILLPLTEGFLLAQGLRTLYLEEISELPEEESEAEDALQGPEENGPEEQEPEEETAEDEKKDEDVLDAENQNAEEEVEPASEKEEPAEKSDGESEREMDEIASPEIPAESVSTVSEPENPPETPESPDQNASQFPVDNIIDGMLSESRPEIPEDLSARIEEDEARSEGQFDGMNFDPLDDEDELMNRLMENIGMSRDENETPIDFQNDLSSDETATEISSMAVELLGEDFDFDSLIEDAEQEKAEVLDAEDDLDWKDIEKSAGKFAETSEGDSATPETNPSDATDISGDEGVFHSEAISLADESLSNLFPDQLDVVSVFPDELCQNTIIKPETSQEAEQFNFVEESRPMFVRKRKGNS